MPNTLRINYYHNQAMIAEVENRAIGSRTDAFEDYCD